MEGREGGDNVTLKDADAIKAELRKRLDDGLLYTLADVIEVIDELPTIDPVKHGKFVNDNGLYRCTACNDHCAVAGWADCIPEEHMYRAFKFCPNCGAKMQRSEDE